MFKSAVSGNLLQSWVNLTIISGAAKMSNYSFTGGERIQYEYSKQLIIRIPINRISA